METAVATKQGNGGDRERAHRVLRLQSMPHQDDMPMPGTYVWVYSQYGARRRQWLGSIDDIALYWIGNTHNNEAQAEEWGATFASSFGIKETRL